MHYVQLKHASALCKASLAPGPQLSGPLPVSTVVRRGGSFSQTFDRQLLQRRDQ